MSGQWFGYSDTATHIWTTIWGNYKGTAFNCLTKCPTNGILKQIKTYFVESATPREFRFIIGNNPVSYDWHIIWCSPVYEVQTGETIYDLKVPIAKGQGIGVLTWVSDAKHFKADAAAATAGEGADPYGVCTTHSLAGAPYHLCMTGYVEFSGSTPGSLPLMLMIADFQRKMEWLRRRRNC